MAQPTMAAVPGLKDTYVHLKTRMDKAVDDFRKALVGTRTGPRFGAHARRRDRRGLRLANAAEPGCHRARPGAAADHGAALRSIPTGCD